MGKGLLPTLKTCCFCFSLRSGSIIICMLDILVNGFLICLIVREQLYNKKGVIHLSEEVLGKISALAVVCTASLCCSLLCLVGIRKENPRFMGAALIIHALRIAFFIGKEIYFFITYQTMIDVYEYVAFGIFIYFFLVLNSYYHKLRQNLLPPQEAGIPPGGPPLATGYVMTQPGQYQGMPLSYGQPIVGTQPPVTLPMYQVQAPGGPLTQQTMMPVPSAPPPSYDSVCSQRTH